jgi:hypothetical protein
MAAKTVKLTSPNGTTVSVDEAKVDGLLSRGFKREQAKAPAKKSASSISSK